MCIFCCYPLQNVSNNRPTCPKRRGNSKKFCCNVYKAGKPQFYRITWVFLKSAETYFNTRRMLLHRFSRRELTQCGTKWISDFRKPTNVLFSSQVEHHLKVSHKNAKYKTLKYMWPIKLIFQRLNQSLIFSEVVIRPYQRSAKGENQLSSHQEGNKISLPYWGENSNSELVSDLAYNNETWNI